MFVNMLLEYKFCIGGHKMDIDESYKELKDIIEKELTCSAHNLDHVFRVYNLCLLLSKYEKDVDLEVLIPAALLHDIARVKESKDKSGEIDHAILGSEIAEEILKGLGYEGEKIEKIKHCIITHRFRTGNEPKTIEAKILFDADKLDITGAIGIALSFILAGQFVQSLSNRESLNNYLKTNTVENGRVKDISKHSPFIEFEIKFKKIPDKLYTQKAKEIGVNRLKIMGEFFDNLKLEMEGIE
jgi:uncharacterized protein